MHSVIELFKGSQQAWHSSEVQQTHLDRPLVVYWEFRGKGKTRTAIVEEEPLYTWKSSAICNEEEMERG